MCPIWNGRCLPATAIKTLSGTASFLRLCYSHWFIHGPITTSILLGLTAALANGLGGAVIVQKDWERRYLRYFVALGRVMLGTAFLEMLPESIAIGGQRLPC